MVWSDNTDSLFSISLKCSTQRASIRSWSLINSSPSAEYSDVLPLENGPYTTLKQSRRVCQLQPAVLLLFQANIGPSCCATWIGPSAWDGGNSCPSWKLRFCHSRSQGEHGAVHRVTELLQCRFHWTSPDAYVWRNPRLPPRHDWCVLKDHSSGFQRSHVGQVKNLTGHQWVAGRSELRPSVTRGWPRPASLLVPYKPCALVLWRRMLP